MNDRSSIDLASTIDSLWDFDDPKASEGAFRDLLDERALAGDGDARDQVLTQLARAQGLQREFDAAHATLDLIEPNLTERSTVTHVRYLLERGRVFNSAGKPEESRPLFESAWDMACADGGLDAMAIDAAHMVGIVAEPVDAPVWNLKALRLAEASSNPRAVKWRGSLLNNMGWTHHDAGEYEIALDHFERALQARLEAGDPNTIRIAKWCIARAKRSLGRLDEALVAQQALLAEHEREETGGDGFVYEELGECLLALGKPDEARPLFAKAYEMLSKDPWLRDGEPERLRRLKELGEE